MCTENASSILSSFNLEQHFSDRWGTAGGLESIVMYLSESIVMSLHGLPYFAQFACPGGYWFQDIFVLVFCFVSCCCGFLLLCCLCIYRYKIAAATTATTTRATTTTAVLLGTASHSEFEQWCAVTLWLCKLLLELALVSHVQILRLRWIHGSYIVRSGQHARVPRRYECCCQGCALFVMPAAFLFAIYLLSICFPICYPIGYAICYPTVTHFVQIITN